jgi:DNA-binding transcriptional LysR family regulator
MTLSPHVPDLASLELLLDVAQTGSLSAALAAALSPGAGQAQPALSLSTTAAVRSAVLAGAAPAVISELAVADDLIAGRLVQVPTPDLDLRRTLRTVWDGGQSPPAGVARDLIAHILGRHLRQHGRSAASGPAARPAEPAPGESRRAGPDP